MFKSKKSANLVFGKGLSSGHKMELYESSSAQLLKQCNSVWGLYNSMRVLIKDWQK